MSDAPQHTDAADQGVVPTIADIVTDPGLPPATDDASGLAHVDQDEEGVREEEIATQLGDFA